MRWGVVTAYAGVALGCASPHADPRLASTPPQWALVSVVGSEGALERRNDATTEWAATCASPCGEYVPAAGTYRLRGPAATSEPFSLPPADMGHVVLRFDDDGHVWTQGTPRALRQPQLFVPKVVLLLR